MRPLDGSGYSDQELAEKSQLPEVFLELGKQGAGTSADTKAWREMQPKVNASGRLGVSEVLDPPEIGRQCSITRDHAENS